MRSSPISLFLTARASRGLGCTLFMHSGAPWRAAASVRVRKNMVNITSGCELLQYAPCYRQGQLPVISGLQYLVADSQEGQVLRVSSDLSSKPREAWQVLAVDGIACCGCAISVLDIAVPSLKSTCGLPEAQAGSDSPA
jgi:hypothetical protein